MMFLIPNMEFYIFSAFNIVEILLVTDGYLNHESLF